jgi:pimeloyl-[acyl-carrier protein] methyl ester esterase
MSSQLPQLILLPGMDGTGELFADLIKELPGEIETQIVQYPTDRCLAYSQLAPLVRSVAPASAAFVLIAESFSTPLSIQYAATKPPNLRGVVICAGFVTNPAQGWLLQVCSLLSPIFFRLPLPEFVVRRFLVGQDAPSSLVVAVRDAVSSVSQRCCRLACERFWLVMRGRDCVRSQSRSFTCKRNKIIWSNSHVLQRFSE